MATQGLTETERVYAATRTICVYCGAEHPATPRDEEPVPAVDDDAAWAELATEHWADCEWIATRAHRINCR